MQTLTPRHGMDCTQPEAHESRVARACRALALAALLTAGVGITPATRAEVAPSAQAGVAAASAAAGYTADGRLPLAALMTRLRSLSTQHGWTAETVYAYPGSADLVIESWRTPRRGDAVWLLSGIHGEEPAGPNAIARNLEALVALAAAGVPVVVIPLCNPNAYRQNWRYPNTPERDWKTGGGYSVGDAEYLLPDFEAGNGPRAPAAPGPETEALTQYVLRMAQDYPPRLVLDLHEDELSTEGGYIYSQGAQPDRNPVGAEIVRLLQAAGIPLRESGQTRFGETIVDGVISRDDKGLPIRDGSIDELLAATAVFVDGKKVRGPSSQTVIVVETPAFEGSKFELRVGAQGAVVRHLPDLWRLATKGP